MLVSMTKAVTIAINVGFDSQSGHDSHKCDFNGQSGHNNHECWFRWPRRSQ